MNRRGSIRSRFPAGTRKPVPCGHIPFMFLAWLFLSVPFVSCGSGKGSQERAAAPSFTPLRELGMGGPVIAPPVFMTDRYGTERLCVASTDGRISVFDPSSGSEIWRAETENGFEAPPVFVPGSEGGEDALVAASLEGGLFLFDVSTGELLNKSGGFGSLKGGAAVLNGNGGPRLYAGDYDGTFYGIDATILSIEKRFRANSYINGRPCLAGPGKVAFGSCDGSLYVLSTGTLEEIFSFETGSYVAGGPVYGFGALYFVNYEGDAFALREDGSAVWEFRVPLQEPTVASPLLTDALLVYGSQRGNVRALDRTGGGELWTFAAGSPVEFIPVETEFGIIVCSTAGRLSLLDGRTGRETAYFTLGAEPSVSAAWNGSVLVIGDDAGRLLFFSLSGRPNSGR